MKYIWEDKDVICGRIVCKDPSHQGNDYFIPTGNALKWTYKIGYSYLEKEKWYVYLSMTDGMVSKLGKTKEEAVDNLNLNEMIPMPHKWFIMAMNELEYNYQPQ